MKKIEYTINVHGSKAVKAGYALQNGFCYKVIKDWNGRFMGQLEVVLDNPDIIYNGISSEWVAISFISRYDIERLLSYLAKNGFAGCPCYISQENLEDTRPDGKKDDGELCCLII